MSLLINFTSELANLTVTWSNENKIRFGDAISGTVEDKEFKVTITRKFIYGLLLQKSITLTVKTRLQYYGMFYNFM